MKNFVNVDTRFQKSINLTLDTGDMALVNRYIPTRSSVSILKQYLTNIVRGQGEHATILIGPYGKGKSHLLLVLLALLCKSKDETAEIQKKIIEADNSTKLLFMELAEVGRPFLPVIVSSFQGDLNESFIFALQEALKKTGIRDLPLPSEYSEAVRTMESWKESYPDTYQRFEKMLEERGCTAFLFKERLKKQKEAALLEFKEFYPVLTSGSVFNPMVQKEALRVYEEVNRVLCAKYGYAGIYIIFDEFSKYIEGHEAKNFAKDMKILQDMCELADSRKEEQMYLTFVAHKSIHEYVKSIDSEMIQAFRGVEGRLKEIRFVVSSQNNYELIEHALHKKEGFYTSEIQERAEESYQLACFSHLFEKEDFNQIVAKGCYPLTPVCAYALLNISEKIGQNERTVFTFLAGNEPGSLNRIMEGRNRENLIGVEYVYDYFKNLFRETVDETYIHNEWLKAEYMVFARSMLRASMELLKSAKMERRDIPYMRQATIDYIIKNKRCICGHEIKKDSSEYFALMEQRNYLPPADVGSIIGDFERTANRWYRKGDELLEEIDDYAKEVDANVREYHDSCNRYEKLQKQLDEHIDFAEKRKTQRFYKSEIQRFSKEKGEKEGRIEACKKRIETTEKEMQSLEARNERNRIWRQRLEIAEELYRQLDKEFSEQENKIFLELNRQIQENFSKMFNAKDKKIELTPKYEIQMLYRTQQGYREEKNLSEGEKIARNFAFIVTIMDFSRRKKQEKTGHETADSDTLPIVLDGPFSKLGDENIELIAKVLPQVSEQVIIFMLKKDWEYTKLDPYVGSRYYIDKKPESLTYLLRF